MCLGVPGRILSVDGLIAMVEFWGVAREIRLDVVDEPVSPGDYVLNHVGFAIRRIPTDQVHETLRLYDELIRLAEVNDPMALDVRGEVEAAGLPTTASTTTPTTASTTTPTTTPTTTSATTTATASALATSTPLGTPPGNPLDET